MASGRYSFIDIAVLEEVRTRFAAGDALVLLNLDLDEVIWANGPGARLLGFKDIEAVMGASAGLGFAARRQIAATPGFPRMGRDKPVGVRLSSGLVSRAITFLVSGVTLPDGEPALLLALQAQTPASQSGDETAGRVIEGFGEAGFFAALIAADGTARATSPGFERLGLGEATIRELVEEVADEDDRLVKRLVLAAGGLLPAGIARLTDDPALHLLVAVDELVDQEEAEEETRADAGEPRDEAAAPSDADLLERLDEDAHAVAETPHDRDGWYFNGGDDQPSSDMATHDQSMDAPEDFTSVSVDASDDGDATVVDEVPGEDLVQETGEPERPATVATQTAQRPRRALGSEPVRFVWRTDAEGRFSSLSPEFVDCMGADMDDLVGVAFTDVAARLGLDGDGEIAGLLGRRDTWSGRTVLWPVVDAGMAVPVDLAALPVYNRDRQFEGFRGFGVARLGDALPQMADLPAGPAYEPDEDAAQPTEPPVEAAGAAKADAEPDDAPDAFRGEVPVISIAERRERRESDKVIRLAEHRTPQVPERVLSQGERNAFEEIRERLQRDYEAGSDETGKTGKQVDARVEDETASATQPEHGSGESSPDTGEAGPSETETVRAVTFSDFPEEVAEMVPADSHDDVRDVEAFGDELYDEPHLATLDGADDPDIDHESDVLIAPDGPDAGETEAAALADDDQSAVEDIPADDEASPDAVEPEADDDSEATVARETAGPAPSLALTGFTPSAFSRGQDAAGADAELIAGLPVAMLVHAGDDLYFANRAFLNLTGDDDLAGLRARGGLDALFAERGPGAASGPDGRKLMLRTAREETFAVDAHLQSIRWRAGSALLLTLQRLTGDSDGGRGGELTQALEDRVAEMRTIIDTATDGVVLIDRSGDIRNISRPAEALFGFESDEVEGRPFETLFAIESRKSARDYLDGLAENGVASVLNDGREVIGREAEGRFIPLFMTIGRLPGESGYCAVVRDITQWKRAEEELTQARAHAERASSQKTEFLARVSHEIRTPLNAIIGFSELMIDEKFGPIGSDRYRDYLRDINRSGNHVLDLVNDLLDISKIEAGEQELNYEAISLNDTLSESVAMMQPQANRERVIIRSSLASRLPEVVADLRSVRQIALNLLSNAIRYTQPGGQVIVSTSYEPSGDVVMRVRDTGVGMTLAEIDQALKPFKQVNAIRRGRHDGTGLGLPLTKAMVEANRARFLINSTPGEGTMVEVTFPTTRVLAN